MWFLLHEIVTVNNIPVKDLTIIIIQPLMTIILYCPLGVMVATYTAKRVSNHQWHFPKYSTTALCSPMYPYRKFLIPLKQLNMRLVY